MGATPRGISASRGAAILGLSEFATSFQIWQEIMEERTPGFNASRGYTLPERKESAPLRWGTAFEDAVVQLAEEATRKSVTNRERLFEVDGFITCHVDGIFIDDNDSDPLRIKILHEGKTTSAFPFREKWGEPGTDRIPTSYAVQTQHQMLCTGAEQNIVSVLVFPETPDAWEKMGWEVVNHGLRGWKLIDKDGDAIDPLDWARVLSQMGYFHQYPIAANHDAQKLLVDGYTHFWNKHVLTGIEPDPKTYDDIKRAFPEPKGTLVCAQEQASWFAEIKSINEEIGDGGSLSKRVDELKVIALDWARKQDGMIDDESRQATIFRNEAGKKLGQFSKNKNGVLMFRAS